jgi:tRNA-guanine transglycosylase
MSFNFKQIHKSKNSRARAGELEVNGNIIQTPVFMPVGTQASVKSLTPDDLETIGAQIILANTYHLYLRPGAETVKKMGGLHNFTNWHKPILTDSGGFQVFSLGYGIEHQVGKIANIFPMEEGGVLNKIAIKHELIAQTEIPEAANEDTNSLKVRNEASYVPVVDQKLAKINDDGVVFTSHLDGSKHNFNSEVSIQTQHKLGADIILSFDECPSPLHDYEYTKNSLLRTHRWEKDSLDAHKRLETEKIKDYSSNTTKFPYQYPHPQYLFGIPHGGPFQDLREMSAKYLSTLDFSGYSIGGSLGNLKTDMHKVLEWQIPFLDDSKPRHLLGIGDIDDLFECIERGIDMFDCVAPTRIARNGALLISPAAGGKKQNKFRLSITNAEYKEDGAPIDPSCTCYTCQNFSRSYVRHLFIAKELLAFRLATYHNVHFMINLVKQIRQSIIEDNFSELKSQWLS